MTNMGLIGMMKEGLETVNDKMETVVDGGKAEVDINKEEARIKDYTRDLGKRLIELLDSGKTIDDDSLMTLYNNIVESRKKIEELKKAQDEYKKKL